MSSLSGKDKDKKLVVLCRSSFGYDAQHLYYADAQRQLVSLPLDVAKGTVSGSPAAAANMVGVQPSTFWAALTVSENGTVIYNTGVGAVLSVLTWMDRSGKELGKVGEPGVVANPTLSPMEAAWSWILPISRQITSTSGWRAPAAEATHGSLSTPRKK